MKNHISKDISRNIFKIEAKIAKPMYTKVNSHYYRKIGHTTPHSHIIKVVVPKGLTMWVPKQSTCYTNVTLNFHINIFYLNLMNIK